LTRQRQAQRAQCDLNSIARQCAKVALQRAGAAIEFEIDLDQNIGEVASDPAMLRQILDNLLSNAIDALGENEGKIHVSTKRDGDRLVLEVADTGCGIPADSLARIFDPFFSLKGPGKGYGLGLAICSTLAESLGGLLPSSRGKVKAAAFVSGFRVARPRSSNSVAKTIRKEDVCSMARIDNQSPSPFGRGLG